MRKLYEKCKQFNIWFDSLQENQKIFVFLSILTPIIALMYLSITLSSMLIIAFLTVRHFK